MQKTDKYKRALTKSKSHAIHELAYWNRNSYGTAVRISRRWLRVSAVALCILTPCTNWLIPFALRLINKDYVIRY
ncbi:hypothetical protein JXB31_04975 [Candidatus Woesearchaeota archaeon]|nr:hypothetical protein [Candidatus Woesearchaeota archaeon]